GVDRLTTRAENTNLVSILEDLDTDALTLATGRVERHHVGNMDRRLTLDDAARLIGLRIRLGVALDEVGVGNDHAVALHAQHFALLTLAFAGGHDDVVALLDSVHFSFPGSELQA